MNFLKFLLGVFCLITTMGFFQILYTGMKKRVGSLAFEEALLCVVGALIMIVIGANLVITALPR